MTQNEFGHGCADWWGDGKKPLSMLQAVLMVIVSIAGLYAFVWTWSGGL